MASTQRARHRIFGLGMLALGAGLALNTVLGPLVADIIEYPFTETVRNETLGLEVVSLLLIAPLAIFSGALALRGHPAAGVTALGPAAYSVYMLVQYVVGPQYVTYEPAIILHLSLFILSGGLLVRAWTLIDIASLPARSRGWAVIVLFFAAFAISRWVAPLRGVVGAEPIGVAASDVTMYWSIFLLDLGIVVPVAIATAVGLLLRQAWASKLVYGVIGWFALVPPSVAAMAIVKIVRGDPIADPGDAVVLAAMALISCAVAIRLYAPLFDAGRRMDTMSSKKSLSSADASSA